MKKWYAVMKDINDDDWGTGSYNKREAAKMLRKLRKDGYKNSFIEIVSENKNCYDSISIGRIYDIKGI